MKKYPPGGYMKYHPQRLYEISSTEDISSILHKGYDAIHDAKIKIQYPRSKDQDQSPVKKLHMTASMMIMFRYNLGFK